MSLLLLSVCLGFADMSALWSGWSLNFWDLLLRRHCLLWPSEGIFASMSKPVDLALLVL